MKSSFFYHNLAFLSTPPSISCYFVFFPDMLLYTSMMTKKQKKIFKIIFVTISTVALVGITILPAFVGGGGFGY